MVNISDVESWIVKAEPFSKSLDFTPAASALTILDFSEVLQKSKGIISGLYVYIVNRGVADEVCYWTLKVNDFPATFTSTFTVGRKDAMKVLVPANGFYREVFNPNFIFQTTTSLLTMNVEFGSVNLLCTALFTLEGYKIK
jgi:hypothetical protein